MFATLPLFWSTADAAGMVQAPAVAGQSAPPGPFNTAGAPVPSAERGLFFPV